MSGRAARWVATVGGLGDRLPAPGTCAGSAPAAVLWWALATVVADPRWLATATVVAVVAATVAGTWAAGLEEQRRGSEDPGPVVVDEVAGQWLTCLVLLPWVELASAPGRARVVLLAFLAFRLCDIAKPWPCRRLERLGGGLGIMADDLVAGLYAGLIGVAVATVTTLV